MSPFTAHFIQIGVAHLPNDVVMVVIASHRDGCDDMRLCCYVLRRLEWERSCEVVAEHGAGVVVFDLDETILFQKQTGPDLAWVSVPRAGFGRFCMLALRERPPKPLEHTFFGIYVCTRARSAEKLWDECLLPKANGVRDDGHPTLPLLKKPVCITMYPRDAPGEWTPKSLRDVLKVHEVEQHCAVIFDDKGLDKETVDHPHKDIRDNWDHDDRECIFKLAPFCGYSSDATRHADAELVDHGKWLNNARQHFVESLSDVGERMLKDGELQRNLINLASFMRTQVCYLFNYPRFSHICLRTWLAAVHSHFYAALYSPAQVNEGQATRGRSPGISPSPQF